MGVTDGAVDQLIAELASRTHGVVTRRTLLERGVSPKQIENRLRRGSLRQAHRGVYRVGHDAPNVEARYIAAVMACGDRALLIARPAAHLWGLIKGSPPPPEVMAPVMRRVQGVKTHRVRRIDSEDIATCRGIPVTTIPRTLVDLAGILSESALARACHEAEVRGRTIPEKVEAVLARLPTRPGAGTLRRILQAMSG